MICFLTSSIEDPETGQLNAANQFIEKLRECFPNPCHALAICSDPDSWSVTDYYALHMKNLFANAGFMMERLDTLDSRNEGLTAKLVQESNLLILFGGHVPTQNHFFKKICLRELLKNYEGVVIGISAGSMNSADTVYAQPEKEGEAVHPAYRRFLTGLNVTKTNLLPHYQEIKDDVLDGLRVFEDIAYVDSIGKTFYAIPDGSYLLIDMGKEELHGEAYMVRDGAMRQISARGEVVSL